MITQDQETNIHYYDLSQDLGLIQIAGEDSFKFLQGLLTCDMNALKTKAYCLGAFCNLKGRVRALFKIFKITNELNDFLLQTPKKLIPTILPALKKHAMFSKIQIKDVSSNYVTFGFSKNKPFDLIPAENIYPGLISLAGNLNRSIFIASKDLNYQPFTKKVLALKDFNEWLLQDIREGVPEIWLETTEQFLPHYINLPALDAVSFKKGCYCGQEIIARMEFKANIKYELKHVVISESEVNGFSLLPGQETQFGTIVSFAKNSENDFELLTIYGKDKA